LMGLKCGVQCRAFLPSTFSVHVNTPNSPCHSDCGTKYPLDRSQQEYHRLMSLETVPPDTEKIGKTSRSHARLFLMVAGLSPLFSRVLDVVRGGGKGLFSIYRRRNYVTYNMCTCSAPLRANGPPMRATELTKLNLYRWDYNRGIKREIELMEHL
jgi:hypothetical protein